jgi:hypothetical protein
MPNLLLPDNLTHDKRKHFTETVLSFLAVHMEDLSPEQRARIMTLISDGFASDMTIATVVTHIDHYLTLVT